MNELQQNQQMMSDAWKITYMRQCLQAQRQLTKRYRIAFKVALALACLAMMLEVM